MGKYTKEQVKQQRMKDIFEDNKYEQECCLKCIYFDAFSIANKFPCTNCDPCGEARYFTKPQKFNFSRKKDN